MKSKPETAIAKKVIAYLHDLQWEVYQEVQIESFGKRVDIVAVQNGVYWAIECKCSFGLSVIEQAVYWKNYATLASVAVPTSRKQGFAREVCRLYGVGVLCATTQSMAVIEYLRPHFNRSTSTRLKNSLCEDHKTFAEAGNNAGHFYSPFQQTCRQICLVVQKNPGILLKDLIGGINHHYSGDTTARANIYQWARLGKIRGIEMRREGKFNKFYPKVGVGK